MKKTGFKIAGIVGVLVGITFWLWPLFILPFIDTEPRKNTAIAIMEKYIEEAGYECSNPGLWMHQGSYEKKIDNIVIDQISFFNIDCGNEEYVFFNRNGKVNAFPCSGAWENLGIKCFEKLSDQNKKTIGLIIRKED